MSATGILQKTPIYPWFAAWYYNIAQHSLVPTILHEFHDSKGHQGNNHTLETIRRSDWWPKLQQDIGTYIDQCNVCVKHLPNMARYPKQHLEVPQIPIAVLAMDTIGHLPINSKGNRWTLTAICLHRSYKFTVSMKEKSAENVVQAYLFGVLAHRSGSVAILSYNGTEFKNRVLNEVCD